MPTPGVPLSPLFTDMPRFVGHQDPNWDVMSFDLDADLARAMKNAAFIEATDPDLATFKARGGKLLLYHGWADPGPAPQNTVNYLSAVAAKRRRGQFRFQHRILRRSTIMRFRYRSFATPAAPLAVIGECLLARSVRCRC